MNNKIKWSIDGAHSEIAFKVRHLMIAHVKGSFKSFDADISTTGKDFTTAEIEIRIDPSSISTGDTKRDEHLKSADFFDVLNHEQIIFTSTRVGEPDGKGIHELLGVLTIKGISKKIALRVQFGGKIIDPWGNERAGFTVAGKINRKDWGLSWNAVLETGGVMVSEEVKIACEVELINAGEKELPTKLEPAVDQMHTQ